MSCITQAHENSPSLEIWGEGVPLLTRGSSDSVLEEASLPFPNEPQYPLTNVGGEGWGCLVGAACYSKDNEISGSGSLTVSYSFLCAVLVCHSTGLGHDRFSSSSGAARVFLHCHVAVASDNLLDY